MSILQSLRTRKSAVPPERGDDALMQQIREGSQEAYLALYERYENAVFAYCRRAISDPDRAADVFQEAFVRVWEKAALYRGGNFEAWLFMIVRNLCRDDYQYRSRREDLSHVEEGSTTDEGPDVMERAALAAALASLAEELREVILLREYEGFSYQEIADITGQSLSSVGVRLFRAKQQLRILLAPLQEH